MITQEEAQQARKANAAARRARSRSRSRGKNRYLLLSRAPSPGPAESVEEVENPAYLPPDEEAAAEGTPIAT
jgi:hypothetical protein